MSPLRVREEMSLALAIGDACAIRRTVHDLGVEGSRLPDGAVFLPLGLCQRAGLLVNEDGRGDQFMDLPRVIRRAT
jgi:hypothetical protein